MSYAILVHTTFHRPYRREQNCACSMKRTGANPIVRFLCILNIVVWLATHHIKCRKVFSSYSQTVLKEGRHTLETSYPQLVSSDIAVVSAVTGQIDRPQLQPGTGIFVYNETIEPLPFPRQDVNQRLRAKYFRMSTHWLLPNYAAYIWVDAAFISLMQRLCGLIW